MSAEMDDGNPKCVLACTAMATVTTAPPVIGRVGQWQQQLPSFGNGSPSCWWSCSQRQRNAVTAPPVVCDGSNSRWRSQTKAATSTTPPPAFVRDGRQRRWVPSRRQRRTTATTVTIPSPVVGGDRGRRQWVPQLLAVTDVDNPKCVLARTANLVNR